jgi:hypothetical protein
VHTSNSSIPFDVNRPTNASTTMTPTHNATPVWRTPARRDANPMNASMTPARWTPARRCQHDECQHSNNTNQYDEHANANTNPSADNIEYNNERTDAKYKYNISTSAGSSILLFPCPLITATSAADVAMLVAPAAMMRPHDRAHICARRWWIWI